MATKDFDFFSGSAPYLIGTLLLLVILWAGYSVGGIALERWFG